MSSVPEGKKYSRYEELVETNPDSVLIELPPVLEFEHLIDDLQELGYCTSDGMKAVAIDFQEIWFWATTTGIEVSAWEALALRRLSTVYVDQARKSIKVDVPAPFTAEATQTSRESVDKFFRGLVKRRTK